MAYYHVRINRRSAKSSDVVKLDLSEEELRTRFLDAYYAGDTITTGGQAIGPADINYIRINRTVEDSSILRPRVVAERRYNRGALAVSDDWYVARTGDDVTDQFIVGPPGSGKSVKSRSRVSSVGADRRAVFVVHGRDIAARDAMFQFLRSLDLRPIEWSQAVALTGQGSPYVGEVLDAAFSHAQAVVVLMTPDDEVRLRDELLGEDERDSEGSMQRQARPNVIFEAGMAMGYDASRTILVELGQVKPFSDVAGRHTIRMTNLMQSRQDLATRLENAGCDVNRSGTDWHSAGEFVIH